MPQTKPIPMRSLWARQATHRLPWKTLALVLTLPLPLLLGRLQPALVSLIFPLVALIIVRTRFVGAALSIAMLGISIAFLTARGWSPIPLGSGLTAFSQWSLLILTMGTPLLLLGIIFEENQTYQMDLEERVAKRTQELVQAEKMAVLGQLAAGMAHEINSPLGAIQASASSLQSTNEDLLTEGPELLLLLTPPQQALFYELLRSLLQNGVLLSIKERRELKNELRHTFQSRQIPFSQDLASLCAQAGTRLDIQPYLSLLELDHSLELLRLAEAICSQALQIQNIQAAVGKAGKVAFALKEYIHQTEPSQPVETHVTQGLDLVLTLYQNRFRSGIKVVTDYGADLPALRGYPDELNQVWTNLINNAIDAMAGQGCLSIQARHQPSPLPEAGPGYLVVTIEDNGPGIPAAIQPRIFEPFFTTKPRGQGSGLGLDIVRQIIDKHQGRIEVASQPGETVFQVWLPVS